MAIYESDIVPLDPCQIDLLKLKRNVLGHDICYIMLLLALISHILVIGL